MNKKLRFAVFFGNRGFFPGEVVAQARKEMGDAIARAGFEPVLMDSSLTRYGAVESMDEAKKFADFVAREKPDGVVVCLPNFGDETAAAIACQDARVPILIQAYPDKAGEMDPAHRRDAFCGKLSIMDVFLQYGIPFTIDVPHVIHPLPSPVHPTVEGVRRCVSRGQRYAPLYRRCVGGKDQCIQDSPL